MGVRLLLLPLRPFPATRIPSASSPGLQAPQGADEDMTGHHHAPQSPGSWGHFPSPSPSSPLVPQSSVPAPSPQAWPPEVNKATIHSQKDIETLCPCPMHSVQPAACQTSSPCPQPTTRVGHYSASCTLSHHWLRSQQWESLPFSRREQPCRGRLLHSLPQGTTGTEGRTPTPSPGLCQQRRYQQWVGACLTSRIWLNWALSSK